MKHERTPPATDDRKTARGRGKARRRAWSLADLRVPERMLVVVLVPLLAALTFAGLRIHDAWKTADRSGDIRSIADASRSASDLTRSLAAERDLTTDPRKQKAEGKGALGGARRATDREAGDFQRELDALPTGAGMDRHRSAIKDSLAQLTALRAAADKGAPVPEVEKGYGALLVSISGVHNQVGGIGENAQSAGWTLYSIGLNSMMLTSQRSMLASAEKDGKLGSGQLGDIVASQLVRDITGNEFMLFADDREAARYKQIAGSGDSKVVDKAVAAVQRTEGADLAKSLPKGWYPAMTKVSEQLTEVQHDVERRVVAAADAQRDKARDQMWTDAAVAAVILVVAAALAYLTSRRLVRGLRSLRASATTVADDHLPEVTRHLTQGTRLPAELEGKVLGIRSREELGDVARAFDRVYLEAVRLGRAQAELREDVNAIFRNLSRRNQNLVQRQLALLTDLESQEPDAQRLARLFQLDHLSTRIRRNSENLLVLAGAEIGNHRSAPLDALALMRTAASEIEQYERVVYRSLPDVAIAGYAANDLVHLTAELLDNAVSFSSPDTQVTVSGQRVPDGRLLLEIRDMGIGMSEDQLTTAAGILRATADTKVDVSDTMGLYVVGTLARKHNVEVRLHANVPSGLVSAVIVPKELLAVPERPTVAVGQAAQTASVLPASPAHAVAPAYTVPFAQAGSPAHAAYQIADSGQPAVPQDTDAPLTTTTAGLPVRTPQARSGRVAKWPEGAAPAQECGGTPTGRPSPEELRDRMSGLHAGIAHAGSTHAGPQSGGADKEETARV
ncbi:nitrate- and nitrite sensing domain-containing protein [Actinomycetota bacterium Odt1-20B]